MLHPIRPRARPGMAKIDAEIGGQLDNVGVGDGKFVLLRKIAFA